jgi:hypothetical protein
MIRKRKRKVATEPTRPEWCSSCGRVTATPGGVCVPCTLRDRAEEAAAAAPPPPPPAPEPPPVKRPVFIGAHPGCFRCGRLGVGMLCGSCGAELFGLPRREGDPVIRFPRNLTIAGY